MEASKKELILSCVGNMNYKSISKIFDISIPYIYQLKNHMDIPNLNKVKQKRFHRQNYMSYTFLKSIILTYFKISNDELVGKSKKKEFVIARMFYIYYLTRHTPLNWTELGGEVNKTHATAIHYISKLKTELRYSDTQKIKSELDNLMSKL